MAADGDATREPDPLVLDALELPDLSAPAPDGAHGAPGASGLAADALPSLADSYSLEDLDGTESDPHRITRLTYGRHIRVLLVESDADRAADFGRAAEESVLEVRVDTVTDIDTALERLQRATAPLLRRALPDIMVVALPIDDAHRLLELLPDSSPLDELPVIVLADTAAPAAERRSFALGAAGHLVAPRQDYERVALIHALPDFIPRARAAHAHLESRHEPTR